MQNGPVLPRGNPERPSFRSHFPGTASLAPSAPTTILTFVPQEGSGGSRPGGAAFGSSLTCSIPCSCPTGGYSLPSFGAPMFLQLPHTDQLFLSRVR